MSGKVLEMRKPAVALEVAEDEFARMCDAHRIDHDAAEMEAEDALAFLAIKARLLRVIQSGAFVVDAQGTPTYTPLKGETPITFYPPTGATYMAMDSQPNDKQMLRTVAALTEMTRSAKGALSKLELPDFQVCTTVGNLFLAPR